MTIITNIDGDNRIERMGSSASGATRFRMKLPVEELELGMQVDELDKPWLESRFLFQGFSIESESDLRDLREECEHVYVTVTRQMSGPAARARRSPMETAKVYHWPKGGIRRGRY